MHNPVQQVIHHLLSHVADLVEHIDQPSPVFVLTYSPLYPIDMFGHQETIDDQIAKIQNGVVPVHVDKLNQFFQVLLAQILDGKVDDLIQFLLLDVGEGLVPHFQHHGLDLTPACLRTELL